MQSLENQILDSANTFLATKNINLKKSVQQKKIAIYQG
jgi:hypothetical protein